MQLALGSLGESKPRVGAFQSVGDNRHGVYRFAETAGDHVHLVAAIRQPSDELGAPLLQTAAAGIELLNHQADSHAMIPCFRSMSCCLANTWRIRRLSAGRSFFTPRYSRTNAIFCVHLIRSRGAE